jgi:hypothetical protein
MERKTIREGQAIAQARNPAEFDVRRRKRRRRRRIFLFLILLFIIVLLILILFQVTYYEMIEVIVPASTSVQANATTNKESCTSYDYDYAYRWEGWDVNEASGLMTPMMEIYNFMDKPGVFRVKFAFIKNDTYPWEDYNTSVEKTAPALWSKDIEVTISPGESVLVMAATEMPEINVAYWTYADITPPQYRDCTITQKTMITENITQKERTVTKTVARTVPLGTYLKKNLLNWLRSQGLPASRS